MMIMKAHGSARGEQAMEMLREYKRTTLSSCVQAIGPKRARPFEEDPLGLDADIKRQRAELDLSVGAEELAEVLRPTPKVVSPLPPSPRRQTSPSFSPDYLDDDESYQPSDPVETIPLYLPTAIKDKALEQLKQNVENVIVLDIGGQRFVTSRSTLKAVEGSLLERLIEVVNPKKGYFIDRDPAHFRVILNFLRNGAVTSCQVLPKDLKYLHELKVEARYYRLPGLVEVIDERIKQLVVVQ